ncbi:MAG: Large extracellular alpha-helical protein, partial [Pedosphaera sp.]|nr:Large extracellular alpha-helical protein [Pedosphaera sp.]
ANNEEIFVGAKLNDRQAFSIGNAYYYNNRNPGDNWRIYAFTDRPAYRPNETVQWKFIARKKADGSAYTTPANQVVEFQITDPRGAKVKEDKITLNAFGSAWGSLALTETMPLGEYNVTFWNEGKKQQIGNATLFRLEEYKLPEFKVSVQTPEENGRKKAFRLGEKVEVTVQADYYFGGAVANASVELIVHQNPFFHFWHREHDFPWFYEDLSPEFQRGRYYGGEGPIIKRETLKTDANGKASLTFDTPRDPNQEYEYRIEARVTDASRREITGIGSVRVTRQRYYVYPEAAHNFYRPQDKVNVEFKALDANDQPVETEGTVKVTRDYWFEIWLDGNGREVKGDELRNFRSRSMIFTPPPAKPGDRAWQLKFRGYQHDDILTRTLKTDTNGLAELTFTPEREGYYRIVWSGEDKGRTNALPAQPIQAETTVWVATDATTELGYRHGGVEIIVDKDTFRVGQKVPVMLSVPTNDRYVLFTAEGEDLYSYQLVHVTGTVKLVELPIEEKHVPNIFLNAALVSDRQIFTDSKQVIVPPTKNFLNVQVKSDREQYQPHETGTFTITTRDDNDQPISAEVAFGLVDESVYYIQSDYAGDPRQFYFSDKRSQQVQTGSTFNQKNYAKLVVGEGDQLIDIRDLEQLKRTRRLLESESAGQSYFISTNFVETLDELEDLNGAIPIRYANAGRLFGVATDSLGLAEGKDEIFRRSGTLAASAVPEVSGAYFNGIGGVGTSVLGKSLIAMRTPMSMPAAPPGQSRPEEPAIQVRSDFRSTIFWQPDIKTDADGRATVKVTYPDSLTGWKATARAVTGVNQFGIATTNTHTKQPLIVRLEAPRFFVVGDQVTISAVVNNNTGQAFTAKVQFEPDVPGFAPKDVMAAQLEVPANGEARADWQLTIRAPGQAKLKVTARGGKYADAMEKSYPIYEHGIEKFIAKSGKVRGDDITVKLNLPRERKTESTTLDVQITPSLAVTMLDALPYLIDYPYGCTEQTMSRFLPAVITAKTLKDLGLKSEDIMGHLFGGIEPATAAATHPKGKHDLRELDNITKQSLERLYDFQHADGGWGWWKQGDSDHFMTAYVVWGLTLAREAGIKLKAGVLNRAATYLDKTLVEEELNYDQQAWMLHALSAYHASARQGKIGTFQTKAFDNLWAHREQLNAYTRALLALSAHNYGFTDQAKILIANLENGVKIDDHPDASVLISGPSTLNPQPSTTSATAHWGEDGIYWRWSDGGVEATAFALRAMLAIDPQNKLVEPVTNWLIKNRRGAQWSNTRDTAITVLAM